MTYETAAAICLAGLGVDVPILFGTVGRSLAFVPEQAGVEPIAVGA
ncbi:hypothetical protein [Streptomyces tauricus]